MNKFMSFFQGEGRSKKLKKNIISSFGLKSISVFISLLIVPITIDYVNADLYGIWLTISSMILWLSYFDIGLSNGFRNRFAEAIAKNDILLARKYVSTTYATLSIIFIIVMVSALGINSYLKWSNILNVDESYNETLAFSISILIVFLSINFVVKIFSTILIASQQPAISSLIDVLGQGIALICIYIMSHTTNGSLEILSLVFSGIPCIVLVICTFYAFTQTRYKTYSPSIKYIDFSLLRNILSLGIQLFFIMLSILLIFQIVNLVLVRNEGAEVVTQYNICYKYFHVLTMVASIILVPFWSAFTDAYTRKDFKWMKNCVKKLERLSVLAFPVLFLMIVFSSFFYHWWIGDKVLIPFGLSIEVAIFILFQVFGALYMNLINGIGKLRMQLIIYVIFGVISIPVMTYFSKLFGVYGVLIVPIIVYALQAIFGKIQLKKILDGKAHGLWNK